ncbi:MAG: topology modulation protein [Psychrobacillus psychrotolerans]
MFWKVNWTPTYKEEQKNVQHELVKKEEWIIDGNYNGTLDIKLHAADTIIFVNISRVICIYRVFKRMIKHRGNTRPDMADGVIERFDIDFLKWVWDYPKTKKPIVLKKLDQLSNDKKVIILNSPRDVQLFLNHVTDE